ncbi:MAG: hypothetical protein WCP21_24250, partial [Armatimonadota bacterium]
AYASGTVAGTTDKPSFQGKLIVFKPQFKDYAFEALETTVNLQGETLAASELQASRGSGIVSGQGTIDHLGGPTEKMAVQAEVQGEGLRLGEVAKLAKKDWPVDGLGEFTASVSGSVAHPVASGTVRLSRARYDDIPIARVALSYAVDATRLTTSDIQARVLDAPLSGALTLEFGKTPSLEGSLSAGELHLQGLSPFWKSGVALGGTATIPRLWVKGPTDNLQGGAQITAPELRLGREIIRDVEANASLAKGRVQLQETTFGAAGGRVAVKAEYDYGSKPGQIAAEIGLQGTNAADLIYLAIPIAQAVDRRPPGQQADLKLSLRSYALRLRGLVEGTLSASGPADSPTTTAHLKGTQLVLDGRDFPDLAAEGSVTTKGIQGMTVALRQGDSLISADGDLVFDGAINANVEGTGINLAQLKPWLPPTAMPDVAIGGQLGFTVVASGQTQHPDLTASVDVVNPSFSGVQFDVMSVPVATLREGQIDVDTLVLKRGEQQIVVDGQLPFSWSLP